jgi:hypothetical protein
MLYLLDTDHLVVLERRTTPAYANLTGRLRQNDPSDLFVSIVTASTSKCRGGSRF